MKHDFNYDPERLWQFVEKEKRRKVLPMTRRIFKKRDLVSQILYEDDEEALDQLMSELGDIWDAIDENARARAPVTRRDQLRIQEEKSEDQGVNERRMLLSALVGGRASQLQWVQLFRQSYLQGRFLNFDEISDWVEERIAIEGPVQPLLTIALPSSYDVIVHPTDGYVIDPALVLCNLSDLERSKDWLVLRWSLPLETGGVTERQMQIPLGGALEQLHNLSVYLAEELQWRQEDATTFVLTDAIPLLPQMRLRTITSSLKEVPWYAMILVDPNTSPQELSRTYQAWRDKHGKGRSSRPLGARKQALVWFALAHRDLSWDDKASLWRRSEDTKDFEDYASGDSMRKAYQKAIASILPGKSSP